MGKLKVLSGNEICKILSQHGFAEIRQKGSHRIMQLLQENTTVTVPVPIHKEVKLGTLQSIIRQSRLPRNLFEIS